MKVATIMQHYVKWGTKQDQYSNDKTRREDRKELSRRVEYLPSMSDSSKSKLVYCDDPNV